MFHIGVERMTSNPFEYSQQLAQHPSLMDQIMTQAPIQTHFVVQSPVTETVAATSTSTEQRVSALEQKVKELEMRCKSRLGDYF
jgi:uncharacterized protein YceH (UPF0502 family)